MTALQLTSRNHLAGLLLGGAVGDALGLPAEGLSPARQRKWWPGDLRHRFLFGRGMISDDTEHAFMTAQALLEAAGDVERFRRSLAWKLRWWFIALPAGVGLATARACIRLWLGVPPKRSGVHSAGNGPVTRSAIIGAVFADDAAGRREFVRAATRLTHVDPRAEVAAQAVAEAVSWIIRRSRGDETLISFRTRNSELGIHPEPPHFGFCKGALRCLRISDDPEWASACGQLEASLQRGDSVEAFAAALGLTKGVTGYAYHAVPVALHAWLRHRGDFQRTLASAIRCGGDTDTVAAIAGALAGCEAGAEGIPAGWRNRLRDWPRSPGLLEQVAAELAAPSGNPVRWFWPGILPRNLLFLAVVLVHGLRRLLPPY
jgi:ADP-ribosylglycohydrolase